MNTINSAALTAGMLLALTFAPAAWAADQRFSLSSEFDNSADKFETGPWMFKMTPPVGLYGQNYASPPKAKTGTADNTMTGLANSEAAVSYNLYEGSATSPEVNLTGTVKVNGADNNSPFNLTDNDYAAQMDVYQNIDRFTARGSLGSKMILGPTGITVSPLLYGSFGGVYQFSDNTSTGIDMSLSQGTAASGMPVQGLSAFVNYKLDSKLKARGYVFRGISSGVPKNTVGGQVYYGF